MRWTCAGIARLTDRARRTIAALVRALGAPVSRPRFTTRLLMLLVAIVALAIWAAMNVPQAIDQAAFRRLRAASQANLERDFQEAERARSRQARAVQSELEAWRRDTGSPDHLTEHYFAARREFYLVDARYQRELAAYHAKLASKYRWAKWLPLASISPDPAPPPDPLSPPPFRQEPGKVYERIGGISVAFSPTGSGLAVGCRDHTIRILELPSRRVLASVSLSEFEPRSLAFTRDGLALFSVGDSDAALGDRHLVWRWNLVPDSGGRAIPWIDRVQDQPGRLQWPSALDCSPDGRTIAVAAGGYLGIPSTGNPVATTSIYGIRLLSAQTGALEWEHRGAGDSPRSVAFAPSGKSLAYGIGPSVVVLDTGAGKLKKSLSPVGGSVFCVAFSPDGRTLAGAGSDLAGIGARLGRGRVTLWDVSTGSILRTLDGPTGPADTVAFSPDGRTVVAGGSGPKTNGWDGYAGRRSTITASEVRLWDVPTGKMVWTATGESGAAFSLAFSPDGKLVAFCDSDYVYVIDARSGRLKQVVMEANWAYHVRDRLPAGGGEPAGGP